MVPTQRISPCYHWPSLPPLDNSSCNGTKNLQRFGSYRSRTDTEVRLIFKCIYTKILIILTPESTQEFTVIIETFMNWTSNFWLGDLTYVDWKVSRIPFLVSVIPFSMDTPPLFVLSLFCRPFRDGFFLSHVTFDISVTLQLESNSIGRLF